MHNEREQIILGMDWIAKNVEEINYTKRRIKLFEKNFESEKDIVGTEETEKLLKLFPKFYGERTHY
jgi:Retroviral aspartyl protease